MTARQEAGIGLSIIARDEEATLPRLLGSIEGAVDQVCLLDTGSQDGTVHLFQEWAKTQALPLGWKIDTHQWQDDFAAARNAANALLDTEWSVRGDCDDEILGAHRLRQIAALAPPDVGAVTFPYRYREDETLIAAQLGRRSATFWTGRIHERLVLIQGGVASEDEPIWLHGEWDERTTNAKRARNLRIARKWAEEEPGPDSFSTAAWVALEAGDIGTCLRFVKEHQALPANRLSIGAEGMAVAIAALGRMEAAETDKEAGLYLTPALGGLGAIPFRVGLNVQFGAAEIARGEGVIAGD